MGTDIEADVMVRPDQRRGYGVQTVDLQAHVGTRRGPRAGLVTLARGRRHHRPIHVQLGLLLATVCAALGVGLLVGTPTASAHALLVRSDPSSGATVASSPKTVKMWFNEEITPDQSSARIVDSDGAVVTGTRPVSSGDPRLLQLALPPLPTDSYGVLWTVTAEDDGHTTTGTVVFGVGVSVAAPAPSDTTPSTSPGDVVRHWLRIGALAAMVGATGILLIFLWIGADPKVEITVTAVERRMLLLAAWSAVVGLGVAAVDGIVQVAHATAVSDRDWLAIFGGTTWGHLWLLRVAALGVLLVVTRATPIVADPTWAGARIGAGARACGDRGIGQPRCVDQVGSSRRHAGRGPAHSRRLHMGGRGRGLGGDALAAHGPRPGTSGAAADDRRPARGRPAR